MAGYTKEDWDPGPDITRDWSLPPNLPNAQSPNLEDRRADRYAPFGMNEAVGLPPTPTRPGSWEPTRGYHPQVEAQAQEWLRPYDYPVYYDKYLGLPPPTDPQYVQPPPTQEETMAAMDKAMNRAFPTSMPPGMPVPSGPAGPTPAPQPNLRLTPVTGDPFAFPGT